MPSLQTVKQIVSLPTGTCTARAVEEFLRLFATDLEPSPTIKTVSSFSAGRHEIERMCPGPTTIFLIPDIAEINAQLMEAGGWSWQPELSFSYENPPLWLAAGPPTKMQSHYAKRCASIQILQSLLEQDLSFHALEDLTFFDVNSTQEAAVAAAKGECEWAITNQFGLEKYSLTPVHRLKHMLIFWKAFCFQPNSI